MRGGAAAVAVALDDDVPRVVLSQFLATGDPGDRLSSEPYHVAAELVRGGGDQAQAAAVVTDGRRRQDELALNSLRALLHALEEARCKPVIAGLLINRTGWITDVLEYSLAWQEHAPVAEGLAVRDALRSAAKALRIDVVELDEKSLPEVAAQALDSTVAAIDARLKALAAQAGRPWRKEQKLACLAAWFAISGQR